MNAQHRLALLVALALLSRSGGAFAAEPTPEPGPAPEADPDRGRALLAEGDRLADDGDPAEAAIRYQQAFERILPGLRRIPFQHEVRRDVTPREELRAYLVREIDEEMTPAELRTDEAGMKALGLIPAELDLKETLIRVYTEEIAAFYDTKTETMHLIREPAAKPPTLLERLFGGGKGFDKDEQKGVIAHELTHALADQNFDIDALQDAIEDDEDRSLALSALVEGEAMLTMFAAQGEDWDGSATAKIPAARLERVFTLLSAFMPMFGGKAMREAPPILSESLVFPYLRGLVFCASLTNRDGWPALDGAYREPPLSTEQVLHPEKYRDQPDPPTAIDLGRLEAPEGWTELGRDVVGEMQIAVLLRRHGGKPAAAGWDGDRFAVFEGPAKRLGLVWRTTWDSNAEAREFAGHYARFQTTKLPPDSAEPDPDPLPDTLVRTVEGVTLALERRGPDVAIVEGFSPEATDALLAAAFRATKSEKVHAKRE